MKILPIISILLILNLLNINNSYSQTNYYEKINFNNFKNKKEFKERIDFDQIDYAKLNAAIFHETNLIRSKRKLDILTYHPLLEKASTIHAKSMVENKFFSHYNAFDKALYTPKDRAVKAGINNPYIFENIAEIIAIEYNSGDKVTVVDKEKGEFADPKTGEILENRTYVEFAEEVVNDWMNSPPHKKNILSKDVIELGIGTRFFREKQGSNFPKFMVVQNFQAFEKVK